MTDTVKNELAKMYALRAGISQLSIDNDKVNSIREQETKEKNDAIKKYKHLKKTLDNDNNKISKNKEYIKKSEKHIENLSRIKEKNKKFSTLEVNLKLIMALVIIATILTIALVFVFFIFQKVSKPVIIYIAYGVGSILLLFAIIKLTSIITQKYKYYKIKKIDKENETVRYYKWKASKFDKEIEKSNESIVKKQNEIKTLSDSVQKQSNILPLYDKQIEKIEENTTSFILPYCAKATAVHNSLVEEFSDFIDERDWGNLDLIIFAYETGRADNIKEALRFIDEERRTNQIVSAVTTATQHICNTINAGFKNLAYAMTTCFDRISNQIKINADRQEKLLSSMNANLNEKLSGINSQIGTAIECIDYNNALMKKQNQTSEQMMREIRPFINNSNQLVNDILTGQRRF